MPGAPARYVRRAVESSLRRLRTDWIDLYQLHFPDPITPMEETLSVLTDLVREGKVRYVGCSNLAGWQIADADWIARTSGFERFVSAQNRYSLLDRSLEADVVPAAEHFGLGVLPYFPLEYGLLTGKYHRDQEAPARLARPRRARRRGSRTPTGTGSRRWRSTPRRATSRCSTSRSPDWPPSRPCASVISGATSGDQVRANAAAMRWEPTADDLAELDEITRRLSRGSGAGQPRVGVERAGVELEQRVLGGDRVQVVLQRASRGSRSASAEPRRGPRRGRLPPPRAARPGAGRP